MSQAFVPIRFPDYRSGTTVPFAADRAACGRGRTADGIRMLVSASIALSISVLLAWVGCGAAHALGAAFGFAPPLLLPGWVPPLFSGYLVFFVLTAVFPFIFCLALRAFGRPRASTLAGYPFVSVVIPAHNEEAAIARCLRSAVAQAYPTFEVIVVDDGSKDLTLPLIETASVSCVRVARNRGKANALNAGLAKAKGDIIVFSDADSWLHPRAIRNLVEGFSDPSIGAVAGTVRVASGDHLLQLWQTVEYICGQSIAKIAQDRTGHDTVISPGPISAFRRDVLWEMGGIADRTLAEDFDATLNVFRHGYRVAYTPGAVAFTDAPGTWLEFYRQRLRWYRGILQTVRVHRRLMFRNGPLGWFWLPFHTIGLGFLAPAVELAAMGAAAVAFLVFPHPLWLLQAALPYVLLVEAFMFGQHIVGLALGGGPVRWRHVAACTVMHPYRLVLNWARLVAVGREWRRASAEWSTG